MPAIPHYEPARETNSRIMPGDFVLLDMWAKLAQPEAVFYDITWTGVCGTPPDHVRNVFEIVRDGRDRAVETVSSRISAGWELRGFEVDDAAREFNRVEADLAIGSYIAPVIRSERKYTVPALTWTISRPMTIGEFYPARFFRSSPVSICRFRDSFRSQCLRCTAKPPGLRARCSGNWSRIR